MSQYLFAFTLRGLGAFYFKFFALMPINDIFGKIFTCFFFSFFFIEVPARQEGSQQRLGVWGYLCEFPTLSWILSSSREKR